MSEDCLFCRIVSGDVPADVIARNDHAVGFRDISPVAPTHVLVIPRSHHANLGEVAAAGPETPYTDSMSRTSRGVAPVWPVSILEIFDEEHSRRSATTSMVTPAISRSRRSSSPSRRRRTVGLARVVTALHVVEVVQVCRPVGIRARSPSPDE